MNINYYKTSDFYSVVLLRSLGYQIVENTEHVKGHQTFTLSIASEEATKIVKEYWNKRVKVDARTFVESINEIKSLIYLENEKA